MGLPAEKIEVAPPKRKTALVWSPFFLSVVFHLLLLSSVPLFYEGDQLPLPPPEKIVRVKFDEPIENDKGQLVDIMDERNVVERPPVDSRFLSDRNRVVPQEQQARLTGPNPTTPQSGANQTEKSSTETSPRQETSGLDLALPDSFLEKDSKKAVKEQRTASVAPSNYLPEVSYGDETLLNTREYAYSSFFIRMKRQIEAVWRPGYILQGTPNIRDVYITNVAIVLNAEGDLTSARVINSSGIPALDREAVHAIEKAAPYINPPEGIIDKTGRIRISDWRFIVTNRWTL